MLNPRVLLKLDLKKFLYGNLREMDNPVSLAPAPCTKAKKVKQLHKGLFS